MKFKKGDYVVLLAGCDGGDTWPNSIPINHCYQLREDGDIFNFFIELDIKGSKSNSWYLSESSINSSDDTNKKLKMRAATVDEIMTYQILERPFHIKHTKKYKLESYDYLIPLLNKLS